MSSYMNTFKFVSDSKIPEKNTFIKNGVRFSVITESLIRVEEQSSSVFCDMPTQSVVNRAFNCPEFSVSQSDGIVCIKTAKCEFYYSFGKKKMIKIILDDKRVVTDFKKGNLKGTCRTLDGTNGKTFLGDGIISRNGVAVLDDSNSLVLCEDGTIEKRKCKSKDIYYFAYSNRYKEAVSDFMHLTGEPPLVPRFALGNWWSRYKAYTQEEYISLMQRFIDEKIPICVATVDMDWHWVDVVKKFGTESKNKKDKNNLQELFYDLISPGWTGYSWNTDLFPSPKEFLKWLKDNNFKTTLNLHPATGCRFFEDAYPDFCEFMGIDKESKQQIPFDITDKKFIEGYFRFLHHPHEDDGVDFWWIDWQQGKKTAVEGLDPLWALNHYHSMDIARDGKKRPLILSRFAGAGSNRYPLGFSGDTAQSWQTLAFQPYFTATASNIGYTWWSHDIGGHHHGKRDDELYLRWLQYAVFSPIMRLHSTANEFMGKEPWKYRKHVCDIACEALRFRHRLIPYIYSANRQTNLNGIPLVQPMYYDSPEKEEAYNVPNEFKFGSELIVCPITEKVNSKTYLAATEAFLPEGRFTDIFSDRIYNGGQTVTLYRDEGSIPVLAKEGAIIPLAVECEKNDWKNPHKLEILIFRGNSSFVLYEDDGESMDYLDGYFAETKFEVSEENKNVKFTINPAVGNLNVIPTQREYILSFRDITEADKISLTVNNQKTDFVINKEKGCIRIHFTLKNTDCAEISFENITPRYSASKKEQLVELLSKCQGNNDVKLIKLSKLLKEIDTTKIPSYLKGPILELDSLYFGE